MLVLNMEKGNKIYIVDNKTKTVLGFVMIADKSPESHAKICFGFDNRYDILRDNAKQTCKKGDSHEETD